MNIVTEIFEKRTYVACIRHLTLYGTICYDYREFLCVSAEMFEKRSLKIRVGDCRGPQEIRAICACPKSPYFGRASANRRRDQCEAAFGV